MSDDLANAIVELKRDEALEIVKRRIENGEDAIALLDECRQGMTEVGDRFQAGDYFLSELILSAEIFKKAVATLDPHLSAEDGAEPVGKVLLATMRGDIHDLGKNILATLLRAGSFDVHDLGVNVEPAVVLDEVRKLQPDFVGFSALITTAFDSMKEAAGLIRSADLVKQPVIMVGGGVTTPAVKEYVGADFQTDDAMAGVAYCVEQMGGK